jgi:hypothetical protein
VVVVWNLCKQQRSLTIKVDTEANSFSTRSTLGLSSSCQAREFSRPNKPTTNAFRRKRQRQTAAGVPESELVSLIGDARNESKVAARYNEDPPHNSLDINAKRFVAGATTRTIQSDTIFIVVLTVSFPSPGVCDEDVSTVCFQPHALTDSHGPPPSRTLTQ